MWRVLLIIFATFSLARISAAPAQKEFAAIPVSDVRLLDGMFKDAQKRDLDYMLLLDPDRLLSGMRAASGLKPKAPLYGGWEKNGSGIVGHYLSACAWMTAATGDPRIKQRMDYIVGEMAEYQRNRGDGGLYASPWEANDWYASLGKGQVKLSNVLPWYVGHKTLNGLLDAWQTGGSTTAKEVLIRYADWCVSITSKLSDAQWRDMVSKEIGAPNEVFAALHAATGDAKYLQLAKRFSREPIVAALEANDMSPLHNHHANTEIPMFTGYELMHESSGEPRWHTAASNFWNHVINEQTFAFGGNSIHEAFIQPSDFERKLNDPCGPETCNTYNLLKLTRELWEQDPQMKYADYVECALFNHILTSIGPAPDSGFAYYTPVRPGHYKRYSLPFDAFWCCVGSGMENHARYGAYIYAANKDKLAVNLFIPSQMRWKEKGVEVKQTTRFPDDGMISLSVKCAAPVTFTMSVRCPKWIEPGKAAARVNGKPVDGAMTAGTYFDVKREWRDGDVLQVYLPSKLSVELTPGGHDAAFFHGPILLAAGLGIESLVPQDFYAGGKVPFEQLGTKNMDLAKVPTLSGDPLGNVGKRADGSIAYTLKTTTGSVQLVPFYKIGLERYSIYFPISR